MSLANKLVKCPQCHHQFQVEDEDFEQQLLHEKKKITENMQLKVLEKEQQIKEMHRQIEELKLKAESHIPNRLGKVVEVEVLSELKKNFPQDNLSSVANGVRGGDIIHKVMNLDGEECGVILWEIKRTKLFSKTWINKLKIDQRELKAHFAILLTQAMPEEIEFFDVMDGVWVCHFSIFKSLALALRSQIIAIDSTKSLTKNPHSNQAEQLVEYLSSVQFRQRIEAAVEAFQSMREELEKEKRLMHKSWAVRERHIEQMMQSTVGLYGDMQAIAKDKVVVVPQLG